MTGPALLAPLFSCHPSSQEEGIPGYFRLTGFWFQDENIIPECMKMNPGHTAGTGKSDSIPHAGKGRTGRDVC